MTTVRHLPQCCSLCYSFSFSHKCPGLVGSSSQLQSYVSYTLVCVHFIVCSMYVCCCSTPSFSVRHFQSVIFQSCKFSYPVRNRFEHCDRTRLLHYQTHHTTTTWQRKLQTWDNSGEKGKRKLQTERGVVVEARRESDVGLNRPKKPDDDAAFNQSDSCMSRDRTLVTWRYVIERHATSISVVVASAIDQRRSRHVRRFHVNQPWSLSRVAASRTTPIYSCNRAFILHSLSRWTISSCNSEKVERERLTPITLQSYLHTLP